MTVVYFYFSREEYLAPDIRREIVFDHVTHNTAEACRTKDQTQLEYLDRMKGQVFNPFDHDYSKDIEKIKEILDD